MPLEKAAPGTPGFGRNIETEIAAGKPEKQAVAIAYQKARGDNGDPFAAGPYPINQAEHPIERALTAAQHMYESARGMGRADESRETKERHEGKLSEHEREEIGGVGSEKRKEMPESVFLEPSSRKYPVKEKKDGEWKYDRELLLAAARRARMQGDEDLARRADRIREREFGGEGE